MSFTLVGGLEVENGTTPNESQVQRQLDEDNVFELIERVGNRKFLFDSEDQLHKNRNAVQRGWGEVSDGLWLSGSMLTSKDWKQARDKWRNLRIYYTRTKNARKGKSGDGREQPGSWIYFKAVDSIMKKCSNENEETSSNLEETVRGSPEGVPDPNGVIPPENSDEGAESRIMETPKSSGHRLSTKRKSKEESETSQLLELLKATGKDEDEFFHFGMSIASKLRKLDPRKAALAQKDITSLLFDIEYLDV